MYCQKCGTQLANDAAFCASCGSHISAAGSPPIQPTQPFSLSQVQSNPEAKVIAVSMAIAGAMLLSLFLPWAQVNLFSVSGSVTYVQLCQLILQASSSLNDAPASLLLVFVPGLLTFGMLVGPVGKQARKLLVSLLKGIDPKGYEKEMRPQPHRYLWELVVEGAIGVFACFFVYSKLSGVGAGSMSFASALGVGFYLFSLASLVATGFGVWGLSAIPNGKSGLPSSISRTNSLSVQSVTQSNEAALDENFLTSHTSQPISTEKGTKQDLITGAGIGAGTGLVLMTIIAVSHIVPDLTSADNILFGLLTGTAAGTFAAYHKGRLADITETCKLGLYMSGALGAVFGAYLFSKGGNGFGFEGVMGFIFGGAGGSGIGIAASSAVRHILPLVKR